jgi:hypothetical protein
LGICAARIGALSALLAATGAICARAGGEIHAPPANATIVDRTNQQAPIRILIVISILHVTFDSSATADS